MRVILTIVFLLAPFAARGAESVSGHSQNLHLDPEESHVTFELGATLHSVEGSFGLTRGDIGFDPDAGTAWGRVVVNARSAETGSARRDRNMHREVLESEAYPEIVFLPERIEVRRHGDDEANVELSGTVEIHGTSKPITIPATVRREYGRIRVRGTFQVPYVEWGLRDYSNFVLRVAPTVEVSLDVVGDLEEPAAPATTR